jgi:NADH-ubiquinone oxidoreductase chain 5
MAAPTPVSALVHSSTLVTAGVYLMIRFRDILGVSVLVLLISVLTITISGLGANFEIDLKKIIALSTLSQLGVIIMSISLGLTELAYFHLLSHALFKSLLFLCAGVFIHGSVNWQDIRGLGVVSIVAPVRGFYFIGCSLALCGFPFLSGFYSKDLILEVEFMGLGASLVLGIVFLATLFTIRYSIRLFLLMFVRGSGLVVIRGGIESLIMVAPISFLFIQAMAIGSGLRWWGFPSYIISLPFGFKILLLVVFLLLGVIIGIKELNKIMEGGISKHSLVKRGFVGGMW